MEANGNLYGAAVNGGDGLRNRACHYNGNPQGGSGTIFKIAPNGEFSVLYRFHGKADGGNPVSLVLDTAGNLYGITNSAGTSTAICR